MIATLNGLPQLMMHSIIFHVWNCLLLGDYLSKLFGGNPAALKDTFQTLLVRLDKLQPQHIFTRHATQATVPSPDDESVELYLNPWHLGYEPCFSLKGPSKMVYILRLFREFLERPFDSASNPILINFKGLQPGAPIPSFQVSISIGFTKSIAMKLILLGAIQTNLTDGELTLLRAMFAFKCIYRSTGNAKEDRFRALQEKFSESSRPELTRCKSQESCCSNVLRRDGLGKMGVVT